MKTLNIVLIAALLLVLNACITLPKSFVDIDGKFVHKPTSTRYPKRIQGWNLLDGATDKVDSEIAASATYQQQAFAKTLSEEFVPVASVYILSSEKINGLDVLKKRLKTLAPDAVQDRQETLKTAYGNASAIIFNHSAIYATNSLISTAFKVESWLIQSPTQKQVVYWITVAKNDKEIASIPGDFIARYNEGLKDSEK